MDNDCACDANGECICYQSGDCACDGMECTCEECGEMIGSDCPCGGNCSCGSTGYD